MTENKMDDQARRAGVGCTRRSAQLLTDEITMTERICGRTAGEPRQAYLARLALANAKAKEPFNQLGIAFEKAQEALAGIVGDLDGLTSEMDDGPSAAEVRDLSRLANDVAAARASGDEYEFTGENDFHARPLR